MIRIQNATLVTPEGISPNMTLDMEQTKIVGIYAGTPSLPSDAQLIDAEGNYVCPGFIDLHLHGGGGYSFMDADVDGIRAACIAHLKCGTTTLLPTSFTDTVPAIVQMIQNVRSAVRDLPCTVPGVHLEGPFLSALQCGAQTSEKMLLPKQENWKPLLQAWPDGIKIIGAAAELPYAMELGRELHKRGIVASIAHSNADYNTCVEALKNGYTDITHIYSGCSNVHRINAYRHGGVVEAGLLEDDFTVQVIADGRHLPPELLRLIYKCKGSDRICLITDALFPAGMELLEGSSFDRTAYSPAMVLEDGVMKLESRDAFAGSIATMDLLVRNMVQLAGVPIHEAITMATRTPARRIGLDAYKGILRVGYDADVLILDKNLTVKSVFALGQKIR